MLVSVEIFPEVGRSFYNYGMQYYCVSVCGDRITVMSVVDSTPINISTAQFYVMFQNQKGR